MGKGAAPQRRAKKSRKSDSQKSPAGANFFEKRVGEYALANKEKDETTFDLDGAF